METNKSGWYRGYWDATQKDTFLGSPSYTNELWVAINYALYPNAPVPTIANRKYRVEGVNINLGKTLCMTDSPMIELYALKYQLGFYDTLRILELVPEAVTTTDAWAELNTTKTPAQWFQDPNNDSTVLCLQAYRLFDSEPVVELLAARGFQTAVYGGSGVGIDTLECRVFDPNRVETVFSRTGDVKPNTDSELDPYDPKMAETQKALILERCRTDPFYFMEMAVKKCQTGAQTH